MKKQKSSKPKHQATPHHAYVARVDELEPATDSTPPGTHLIEYAGRLKRKLDELRKELEHARKERDEGRRVVELLQKNAELRETLIYDALASLRVSGRILLGLSRHNLGKAPELDRLNEGEAKDTAAEGRGEVVMAKIKLPVPASGLAKIAEEVSSLAKADGRTAFTGLTRPSGDCLVIYSIPNDEEGAK